MERDERKTLCKIIAAIGIGIILGVYFYTLPVKAENASYTGYGIADDNFTEETSKEPEKCLFDENSAMPCVDSEAFRSWYEEHRREYEPQTSEEARTDGCREDHEADREVTEPEPVSEETETEVEAEELALYRIQGQTIDEGIQILLHHHLEANGIGWWYEFGLCQIFQESGGDRWAENRNGLDKGILQYRTTYWTEPESIFNVEAQIRKYSQEMAARFNSGLTVEEAISRHKTSDYCSAVDWQYVEHVKSHLNQMERIK